MSEHPEDGVVPGTASSLLVQGTVVSHTDLSGDGEPNLHPTVRAYFDEIPIELREPFLGYCAESTLVSDQLWALDARRPGLPPISLAEAAPHFAGAAMTSKMIREHGDPDHGRPTEPCRACQGLLDRLGIEFIRV
ncbi:YwqJ-related putative deaminase [Streptomyces sp. GS7]|uniref:YwqJ-related putative deaminase n=1 Tax=Streptomyces sp. GS7 TaxID=2692234 RepID=UPI0022A84101|nr:YwqJ-related putative deaminase [Streptomyces sp. GS7]